MTDLRQQQNRMAFGKEEKEVGYGTGEGTKGLGMIGQENDGRIRAGQIDQRTRAKLSKKNPGWGGTTTSTSTISGMTTSLKSFGSSGGMGRNASIIPGAPGLRSSGVNGPTTNPGTVGTASSIAFTPVQGLELVDPKVQAELSRKRKAEEDRWFKGGTFTQVGSSPHSQSTKPVPGTGSDAAPAFKVPQLPASNKKANTATTGSAATTTTNPGKISRNNSSS